MNSIFKKVMIFVAATAVTLLVCVWNNTTITWSNCNSITYNPTATETEEASAPDSGLTIIMPWGTVIDPDTF